MLRTAQHPVRAPASLVVSAAVCAALTSRLCAAQRQDAAFNESVVQIADAVANDFIADAIGTEAARAVALRPVPSASTHPDPGCRITLHVGSSYKSYLGEHLFDASSRHAVISIVTGRVLSHVGTAC